MRMTMMVTTTISSTKVKPRRLLPLRIRGPIQSYFIGGAANVDDAGLGLAHGLAGVLRNGAPILGVAWDRHGDEDYDKGDDYHELDEGEAAAVARAPPPAAVAGNSPAASRLQP